jgi:hypothetical protein
MSSNTLGNGSSQSDPSAVAVVVNGRGGGGLLTDRRHARGDAKLIEKAARWNIDARTKERLKARAELLATSDDGRVSVSAIRAMIAMDGTDARREAIESQEGIAQQGAALTVLRDLHRSVENRDLIAQLTDGTIVTPGVTKTSQDASDDTVKNYDDRAAYPKYDALERSALVGGKNTGGDERVPPPPPPQLSSHTHQSSLIRHDIPPTDVVDDVYLQISE